LSTPSCPDTESSAATIRGVTTKDMARMAAIIIAKASLLLNMPVRRGFAKFIAAGSFINAEYLLLYSINC
jgi:hypothetical protein